MLGCLPPPGGADGPDGNDLSGSEIDFATSTSALIGSCAPGVSAGSSTKTKKIMYDLADNDDFDREEIATYEEVARLFPRPGLFRPIVLIGAPGVGRNELKRRLMATEPDRYKTTIPRKCFSADLANLAEAF